MFRHLEAGAKVVPLPSDDQQIAGPAGPELIS
jgi:hypothetical protein